MSELKNILNYSKIIRSNNIEKIDTRINTFLPEPNEDDYSRGYINRYFIQKSNDNNSQVYEIDEASLGNLSTNPYWKICRIRWKISGEPNEIMEANSKSIKFQIEEFPNLGNYIPFLLQFAKVN